MLNHKATSEVLCKAFPASISINWDKHQIPFLDLFWVLPTKQGYPRWIIPHNPKYGLSAIRQWKPYGKLSAWKWSFLLNLYKHNSLQYLPGTYSVGVSSCKNNWLHFGWKGSEPPIPVIYVGTPSRLSRLIVQLVEPTTGSAASIVKIPFGEDAKVVNLWENRVLQELLHANLSIAPIPQWCDLETGITAETPLKGNPSPSHITKAHLAFLKQMQIVNATTSLQEQAEMLILEIQKYESRFTVAQLNKLDQIYSLLMDTTCLPSMYVHGDFAPWNLKLVSSCKITAFDWERALLKGLPWYDLMHFYFIQAYLFKKNRNILQKILTEPLVQIYNKDLKLEPKLLPKVYLFYLLRSWHQRLQEGNLSVAEDFFRELVNNFESLT